MSLTHCMSTTFWLTSSRRAHSGEVSKNPSLRRKSLLLWFRQLGCSKKVSMPAISIKLRNFQLFATTIMKSTNPNFCLTSYLSSRHIQPIRQWKELEHCGLRAMQRNLQTKFHPHCKYLEIWKNKWQHTGQILSLEVKTEERRWKFQIGIFCLLGLWGVTKTSVHGTDCILFSSFFLFPHNPKPMCKILILYFLTIFW